jgi:hypothetical protein
LFWEVNAHPLPHWRELGSPILGMISLWRYLRYFQRPFLLGWKGLNPLGEGIHKDHQNFVAPTRRHRNKVYLPFFPEVSSNPWDGFHQQGEYRSRIMVKTQLVGLTNLQCSIVYSCFNKSQMITPRVPSLPK